MNGSAPFLTEDSRTIITLLQDAVSHVLKTETIPRILEDWRNNHRSRVCEIQTICQCRRLFLYPLIEDVYIESPGEADTGWAKALNQELRKWKASIEQDGAYPPDGCNPDNSLLADEMMLMNAFNIDFFIPQSATQLKYYSLPILPPIIAENIKKPGLMPLERTGYVMSKGKGWVPKLHQHRIKKWATNNLFADLMHTFKFDDMMLGIRSIRLVNLNPEALDRYQAERSTPSDFPPPSIGRGLIGISSPLLHPFCDEGETLDKILSLAIGYISPSFHNRNQFVQMYDSLSDFNRQLVDDLLEDRSMHLQFSSFELHLEGPQPDKQHYFGANLAGITEHIYSKFRDDELKYLRRDTVAYAPLPQEPNPVKLYDLTLHEFGERFGLGEASLEYWNKLAAAMGVTMEEGVEGFHVSCIPMCFAAQTSPNADSSPHLDTEATWAVLIHRPGSPAFQAGTTPEDPDHRTVIDFLNVVNNAASQAFPRFAGYHIPTYKVVEDLAETIFRKVLNKKGTFSNNPRDSFKEEFREMCSLIRYKWQYPRGYASTKEINCLFGNQGKPVPEKTWAFFRNWVADSDGSSLHSDLLGLFFITKRQDVQLSQHQNQKNDTGVTISEYDFDRLRNLNTLFLIENYISPFEFYLNVARDLSGDHKYRDFAPPLAPPIYSARYPEERPGYRMVGGAHITTDRLYKVSRRMQGEAENIADAAERIKASSSRDVEVAENLQPGMVASEAKEQATEMEEIADELNHLEADIQSIARRAEDVVSDDQALAYHEYQRKEALFFALASYGIPIVSVDETTLSNLYKEDDREWKINLWRPNISFSSTEIEIQHNEETGVDKKIMAYARAVHTLFLLQYGLHYDESDPATSKSTTSIARRPLLLIPFNDPDSPERIRGSYCIELSDRNPNLDDHELLRLQKELKDWLDDRDCSNPEELSKWEHDVRDELGGHQLFVYAMSRWEVVPSQWSLSGIALNYRILAEHLKHHFRLKCEAMDKQHANNRRVPVEGAEMTTFEESVKHIFGIADDVHTIYLSVDDEGKGTTKSLPFGVASFGLQNGDIESNGNAKLEARFKTIEERAKEYEEDRKRQRQRDWKRLLQGIAHEMGHTLVAIERLQTAHKSSHQQVYDETKPAIDYLRLLVAAFGTKRPADGELLLPNVGPKDAICRLWQIATAIGADVSGRRISNSDWAHKFAELTFRDSFFKIELDGYELPSQTENNDEWMRRLGVEVILVTALSNMAQHTISSIAASLVWGKYGRHRKEPIMSFDESHISDLREYFHVEVNSERLVVENLGNSFLSPQEKQRRSPIGTENVIKTVLDNFDWEVKNGDVSVEYGEVTHDSGRYPYRMIVKWPDGAWLPTE